MLKYGCWDDHLGDVWAFASWCLKKRVQSISTITETGKSICSKLEEIIPLFTATPLVELINEPANIYLSQWEAWGEKYLTTVDKWDGSGEIITYQFDGRLHADTKIPPESVLHKVMSCMQTTGLEIVKLGTEFSLAECIAHLANSRVFVGVDSGFSHLAHSVGVPTILVEHKLDITPYHSGNEYYKTSGVKETIKLIEKLTV